jgi:catechol 2,3-dioxygenase-like lactoylglutathione lyase family enzyme
MRVKRITANIKTADIVKAEAFYHDVLGLECIMDHGWIRTYGIDSKMTIQVSFASEGDLEHLFRICLSKLMTLK